MKNTINVTSIVSVNRDIVPVGERPKPIYVGVDPSPPVISCDGATPQAMFHCYQAMSLAVNGIKVFSRLYPVDVQSFFAEHPEYGISFDAGTNIFSSENASYKRIKITDIGSDNVIADPFMNPTSLINLEEQVFTVCLAPACINTSRFENEILLTATLGNVDRITYQLNYEAEKTYIVNSAVTVFDMLEELSQHLLFIENTEYRYIDRDSNGRCAVIYPSTNGGWRLAFNTRSKGSLHDISTTLKFIKTNRPNDFTTVFLGADLELHSCGVFDGA